MKLNKQIILELGQILKDEFNLTLKDRELEKLAYYLVGYFDLLIKINNRNFSEKGVNIDG